MDQSDFLGLKVGDAVAGLTGAQPIFVPGPSRWYALRVRPQKEAAAEAWLARRGVYGFHPVLRRRSVKFGKVVERSERYLPGYVFARFGGEPLIHRVASCSLITGAITRQDGQWGILDPKSLQAIHMMRAVDAETEARRRADQEHERRRRQLNKGDKALFSGGVFAGFPAEVVELLGAGRVSLLVAIYGREVIVDASCSDVVRTEGLTRGSTPA